MVDISVVKIRCYEENLHRNLKDERPRNGNRFEVKCNGIHFLSDNCSGDVIVVPGRGKYIDSCFLKTGYCMTNQLCHKDERFNDLPGGVVGFFAKKRSKIKKRKSK